MNQTPESSISKWLETQGYPLEMLVAREFRKGGFRTIQSEYYTDPETDTKREIDIYASAQESSDAVLFRVSLCIECKQSREKPWVLFTSEDIRLASRARVVQRASTRLGENLLQKLMADEQIQRLKLFSLASRPAYGITQAFTSGQDIPYAACMGAAKCAAAKVNQANQYPEPVCEVSFPVVIVDGKLFESYLSEDGEVIINEVESGTLVWRNPVVAMPHTIVRISTLSNLKSLVSEAASAAGKLFEHTQEVKELARLLPSPKGSRRY